MSTYWLRQQLAGKGRVVTDGGDPVLTIKLESNNLRVYCPDSDEYIVDADLVEKAYGLGANVVAYSNTWCKASYEAKAHGQSRDVDVIPFGSLFAILRSSGVDF